MPGDFFVTDSIDSVGRFTKQVRRSAMSAMIPRMTPTDFHRQLHRINPHRAASPRTLRLERMMGERQQTRPRGRPKSAETARAEQQHGQRELGL